MSVRIRLSKTGKKHQISFRIVAQDARTKRDGKFLEILGFYNPHKKPPEDFKINSTRLVFWLKNGAQPTEAVSKLIGNVRNAHQMMTDQKDKPQQGLNRLTKNGRSSQATN